MKRLFRKLWRYLPGCWEYSSYEDDTVKIILYCVINNVKYDVFKFTEKRYYNPY